MTTECDLCGKWYSKYDKEKNVCHDCKLKKSEQEASKVSLQEVTWNLK